MDETSLVGQVEKNGSANPAKWTISREVININNSEGGTETIDTIVTPVISYNHDAPMGLFSNKGIYKLNLYSKNNSLVKAGERLTAAINAGAENHWFYHDINHSFPKDLMEASMNGISKQFPSNSKPGYLAVGLELESGISDFKALPRTEDPFIVPYTFKLKKLAGGGISYYSFFPGFEYKTNCGLYIKTLKDIKVIDESAGSEVSLMAYGSEEATTVIQEYNTVVSSNN